jgi:hypothetical protein
MVHSPTARRNPFFGGIERGVEGGFLVAAGGSLARSRHGRVFDGVRRKHVGADEVPGKLPPWLPLRRADIPPMRPSRREREADVPRRPDDAIIGGASTRESARWRGQSGKQEAGPTSAS